MLYVDEKDLAQIAQLVEQRTENPRVAGSIPALGIFYWICELHNSSDVIDKSNSINMGY